MQLAFFKRGGGASPANLQLRVDGEPLHAADSLDSDRQRAQARLIGQLARQASTLGREAAEVRGALDDTLIASTAQGQAVQALRV